MKSITVALAGNPNVGKTSILNHLAGTSLKVGNWPGVTVEKREGKTKFWDYEIKLIDLPGVYTLEPISEDEWVAYKYITEERPDLILNVIETPNMERDLLLTVELLEHEVPMILVLNMSDEAQKLGIEINEKWLSELLGVRVLKTNGRTGEGVKAILPNIVEALSLREKPKVLKYSDKIEEILEKIREREDETKAELIKKLLEAKEFSKYREDIRRMFGKDAHEVIKDERYAKAHGLYREVVSRKALTSRDITDSLDKVLLHPLLGIPLFFFIMFLLFKVSFDFSAPLMDWVDGFIGSFLAPIVSEVIRSLGLGDWIERLFSEAVVGGVGFVLTFVPLIAVIYFLLALLEFSGYLPRVAFLMDRFMHRIGLHGKSLVPLLLGFGCNVPAIVATRTLETKRDKLLVIAMIPFMSCPARLVVFSFFAVIFFKNPAVVIFSLYIFGILVALMTAFLLRKTTFKGSLYHFVMELPPYRLPTLRLIFRVVWAYVKDFLYRAGTLIFAASVLIWFLLNLPPGVKNPSESLAAHLGRAIAPLFKPLGLDDWRMATSLIPAFLAREIVLSSMGTIYASEIERQEQEFKLSEALREQVVGLGRALKDATLNVFRPVPTAFEVEEEGTESLKSLIASSLSPASALAFMVFLLLYTSCLGTVAVMWREVGKKFALLFLVYSLLVGWTAGFILYRVGGLIWNT
ncbi:MAG: ferrous iron transport protein B [Aquificaceae bacterium]|nr:ferrous iron transport protein B [Aquificaceae bacterium]MDW8067186.1 ferrous iron transport protein B [Aquificaceae bacterium]MDW8423838.1 ferrous iron transport protein B [Aquificaceae bacterium]